MQAGTSTSTWVGGGHIPPAPAPGLGARKAHAGTSIWVGGKKGTCRHQHPGCQTGTCLQLEHALMGTMVHADTSTQDAEQAHASEQPQLQPGEEVPAGSFQVEQGAPAGGPRQEAGPVQPSAESRPEAGSQPGSPASHGPAVAAMPGSPRKDEDADALLHKVCSPSKSHYEIWERCRSVSKVQTSVLPNLRVSPQRPLSQQACRTPGAAPGYLVGLTLVCRMSQAVQPANPLGLG